MKNIRKLVALLVALAMTAMLGIVAFAADDDPEPTTKWVDNYQGYQTTVDETNAPDTDWTHFEANPLLVKYLDIAEGVTKPNASFTFHFEALESGNVTQQEAAAFTPADVVISTADMTATVQSDDGNSVAGAVEVLPLFKNGDTFKFNKTGLYIYRVTELKSGTTETVDGGQLSYNINGKNYVLRIYVVNDGTSGYTVRYISIADEQGEKVDGRHDPTEEKDPYVDEEKDLRAEGFRFENNYTKESPLSVQKVVTGEFADYSQAFPFTITLTLPFNDSTTSVGYTVAGGEAQTAAVTNKTVTITGSLKNGEKIEIPVLPTGTTYNISESLANIPDADQYSPSWVLTKTPAATGVDAVTRSGEGEGPIADLLEDTYTANDAVVTNAFEPITVTGVLMNNLPYIVLALVAAGGLVAYVVVRRKADEA